MTDWAAFFEVHRDMPRQGPGTVEDVAWALDIADLPSGPVIVDLAAGPGADSAALLRAPGARVIAIDKHARFLEEARARHGVWPDLAIEAGDMAEIADHAAAPFDMIWCAGALYLLGLKAGLETMARALKPGGVLAFSEPVFFGEEPSADARAFWEGYATRSRAGIEKAVREAGFEVLDGRPVSEKGWADYYDPLKARIAALRGCESLSEMLEYCASEPVHWARVKHETGYHLCIARKQGR